MSIPPGTWTKGEMQVGIICSIVILILAIFWYVNSAPSKNFIFWSIWKTPNPVATTKKASMIPRKFLFFKTSILPLERIKDT